LIDNKKLYFKEYVGVKKRTQYIKNGQVSFGAKIGQYKLYRKYNGKDENIPMIYYRKDPTSSETYTS
jgi:hypothetical protein